MQLSRKPKKISETYSAFVKSISNLERFEKKLAS